MIDPTEEQRSIIRHRIAENIEAELAKLPPSPDRFRASVEVWSFIKRVHYLNAFLWAKL